MQTNEILHEDNLDQIVGFIEVSAFKDVLLLVNPSCENPDYAKRILWMLWYSIKLRSFMANVTLDNYEAAMNNDQVRSLLFGEMDFTQMEEMVCAPDEDDEDEEDEEPDFGDDDDDEEEE